jgi:glutathione S-transferase
MRLYYHPMSSNARRVLMTALDLGIKFDLVEVNLANQEARGRLVEVNPNSKIPVLDDDGFLLWESAAIMQYLADKTPGQTLFPQEPRARADVNRWMYWSAGHFSPAVHVFAWENLIKKFVTDAYPNPVELERGERDLIRFATVLDGHLASRRWICGDAVTLADYAVASPLMFAERARVPVEQYTNILAWFERVRELDAWRQTEPVW